MRSNKPIAPTPTDLRTANPQGRLDVLGYKLAEQLIKGHEQSSGLSGLWDNLEPHIHDGIGQLLTGIALPAELKVLLGILQANVGKFTAIPTAPPKEVK